jgi:cytochrome c biogenesis protein CcdA
MVPLAVGLIAEDYGRIRLRLPQRTCQTEKVWAHEFGFAVASAMWGFHVGLAFATHVTYGGFWILVMASIAIGDPNYSLALLLAYWVGRALPVWIVPLLWQEGDTPALMDAILANRPAYRRSDALALGWSLMVAVTLLVKTPILELGGGAR